MGALRWISRLRLNTHLQSKVISGLHPDLVDSLQRLGMRLHKQCAIHCRSCKAPASLVHHVLQMDIDQILPNVFNRFHYLNAVDKAFQLLP